LIGGGNQLSSHIPRRNNGEEDCEEGDEEGREEALSFDAPMTGVISPPFFLYADDPERIHMAKTTVKKAAAMKPVKKAAKQGSKTC
jgi:hypothetical protein